jgi:hypothetical protein
MKARSVVLGKWFLKVWFLAAAAACAWAPGGARACTACYGQSDSPLAAGMNWGIFTLLGFIVAVLVGIASAGVFLARRAAAHAERESSPVQGEFDDFMENTRLERGGITDDLAAVRERGRRSYRPRHRCEEQPRPKR